MMTMVHVFVDEDDDGDDYDDDDDENENGLTMMTWCRLHQRHSRLSVPGNVPGN